MLSGVASSGASGRRSKNFAAGTYTARNIAKLVSGVGFPPDVVFVKDRMNSNESIFGGLLLNTFVSGSPSVIQAGANVASDPVDVRDNLISSKDASDGFNITADDRVCKTSAFDDNFFYWAWRRSEILALNKVLGDGNAVQEVAHGLGVAPKMIWVFTPLTAGQEDDVYVYHASNTGAPETDYLKLNTVDATADLNTVWNDTAPDSTNVTLGSTLNVNSRQYFMMSFAEVAGQSKFGSYTGNGSATGPIITGLGFIPSAVLIKRTDTGSSHWVMVDRSRRNVGVENYYIAMEDTATEFGGVGVLLGTDLDTFQPISDNSNTNANGGTYIYAAFA